MHLRGVAMSLPLCKGEVDVAQVRLAETAAGMMTRDVITAGPAETAAGMAAKMGAHGISAVPVVDAAGRLVGIVSEGDLMRSFGLRNAMCRAWWLDILAEGEELAPEFLDYIRVDNRRATDLMTRDVVSVSESAGIDEIVDLLVRHRIKRVPVLRDGRVVGIVSRGDIIRTLSRRGGAGPGCLQKGISGIEL
jgi:CBS domain-containing protein